MMSPAAKAEIQPQILETPGKVAFGGAPVSTVDNKITRAEAHDGYRNILAACKTDAARQEAARELARRDRFFLLVYVLGRKDVDRDWLFARCREVDAEPYGRLDLWARFHYKSTIITYAGAIQEILRNPEVTIGIFSHTRPIAKGFLVQIKREFEENARLKALFPDILYENPKAESPGWSVDNGIIVKRRSNPKEATVEAHGLVDGQPTSKHFGILIYDDVVTRESVTTPDMMAKVTEAWALSLNLGHEGAKTVYAGTRYHYNDTYKTIMDRQAAAPRIHPATADGTVDGEPVFMGREDLAKRRREYGSYVFACQMLLDPKADEAQGFDINCVKAWSGRDWSRMNLYILVDPASKKNTTSDYTTMQVIGLGEDENYYWVAGIRDRLNLTERGKALMRLHREYRPKGVGYEEYGLQADIEYVKTLQTRDNYRFEITPLGGQISKLNRIRRLVPILEDGRWYMPAIHQHKTLEGVTVNVVQEFLDELDAFPVGSHDDLIDGAARIVEEDLGAKFPASGREGRTTMQARANSGYNPLRWRQ